MGLACVKEEKSRQPLSWDSIYTLEENVYILTVNY